VRWRQPDGRLTPVRCGAPNRCPYCAWRTASENAQVIYLDALEEAPTCVLTTTTALGWERRWSALREAEAQLWRWLRAELGRVEYCGFLEWTTGRSARSRGQRLPHLHHFVKGIPQRELAMLAGEISARWLAATGGDAWRVDLRPITSAGGAIRYFVVHHEKQEQAPPSGVAHTKRFRPSKGYFARPVRELREQAAAQLVDERLRRAVQRWLDFDPLAGETYTAALANAVETERAQRQAEAPELVFVNEAVALSDDHEDAYLDRLRELSLRPVLVPAGEDVPWSAQLPLDGVGPSLTLSSATDRDRNL
jgi:hypothetical protein